MDSGRLWLEGFLDGDSNDEVSEHVVLVPQFLGSTVNRAVKAEYKHSEITATIIGAAMQVHSTLGNGFQEVIYQRALGIEMEDLGLAFQRELEMPIFYRAQQIGTRRVDFLVEEKVIVELKALTQLEAVHLAQGINYLEAYRMETGLLINFGAKRLQYKRLINTTPAPHAIS